ncbi:MAG TPA: FG-GAP-like repeat-containing protein [Cyclobacteriaceae bacterium]
MRIVIVALLVMMSGVALAQIPVITNVDQDQTYPGSKLVISGSGFSSTPANLDVWFENVKGTITASSDFSIEVTVPIYSKSGNIEVLNKVSRRSTKSFFKFTPYFSGDNFDGSKFTGSVSFSGATNEVFDICTCDFDLDGKPDIAATKQGTASEIMMLRNTSTIGTLSFAQTGVAVGSPTFNAACGDLNGDGKPDLVASRGGATRNEVFVRVNTSTAGAISFSTSASLLLDVSHVAFRLSIRDLNQDGRPEIIVSNAFQATGNVLYVFLNESTGGTLSINPTPVKITVPEAASSYGLDVQDLDGDNLPEIIFNQFNNPDIFVLKNTFNGSGISFSPVIKLTLSGTLNHLITADFNNDNRLDIAVTNSTVNNKVHVLMNTTQNNVITFGPPMTFDSGDGPWGLDAVDIDGDKDVDIIVGNIDFNPASQNTELTALINNGSFPNVNFSATTFNVGKKTRNVEVGDFDGDAKPDIAFTTVSGNSADVLRSQICFVPQILNTPPIAICSGQTVILNGLPNPAATYQWLESGAPVPSNTSSTLSITTAGDYTLTATTEAGACVKTTQGFVVTTDAGSVTQNPTITGATGGVISVCIGSSLTLQSSDTDPGFSWTGPNGFNSSSKTNSIPNMSNAQAGIYTLQLSNGVCKSNVATVRVDVASLAAFNITSNVPSNTVCTGGSVTLSTGSQAGYTYQWIKDGSDINLQTGTSLVANAEGTYKVRVTSPAPLSCSSETSPVKVQILTTPVAAFNAPATACTGTEVTFTDQSTGIDSRGTATYAWTFGDASTAAVASPKHTYANAVNATVSLTVGYNGVSGCTGNASKPVNVVAATNPAITASATSLCKGDKVDLSIPATYTSIAWTGGATTAATQVSTAGTYTVTAKDPNGCNTTAQVVLAAKPVPTIVITPSVDPPSISPGLAIILSAAGADTYAWLPAETLSNSSIAAPTATPQVTTTYTVTGGLNGGCTATASITVQVDGSMKFTNVFTPNGDGFNDLWVIQGIETLGNCTITVFDSFGSQIFEQKGYQNNWDGTYNGKKVPRGTYYYIVNCPDKSPVTGHLLVAY